MTNKEIISLYEGLMSLRQDVSVRLPARSSFALARDIKILQPIVEDIFESRQKTLDTYAEPDTENPGSYKVPAANQEIVVKELSALDEIENDVQLFKIKLADIENIEISVQTMDALYPLIEEES